MPLLYGTRDSLLRLDYVSSIRYDVTLSSAVSTVGLQGSGSLEKLGVSVLQSKAIRFKSIR